jgi:catechol 2,3-dioxygenase-like lactoylglutathione lyase family enzyme
MAMTTGTPAAAVRANVRRPRRLHHAAWVTRDQEATRHFYEDILGLPLVATWAEPASIATPSLRWVMGALWRFSNTPTRTNSRWI